MKPSTDWSFDRIDSCKENIYTMYNESNQPGKKSYKGLVEVEIMSSDGSTIRKFYLTWKFAVREKVLAKWVWSLIWTILPMSVLLIILAAIICHYISKMKKIDCFDDTIDKERDIYISYSDKDWKYAQEDLLPILEELKYVCYLKDRDLVPGTLTLTYVFDAVTKSSCTIIVLSNNFVENEMDCHE